MNFREIFEGWKNDLIPPAHLKELIQQVSTERLSICATCPYDSHVAQKPGYHRCLLCKCPLKKKTKCLSCSCPDSPPRWLPVTDEVTRYEIEKSIKEDEENKSGNSNS